MLIVNDTWFNRNNLPMYISTIGGGFLGYLIPANNKISYGVAGAVAGYLLYKMYQEKTATTPSVEPEVSTPDCPPGMSYLPVVYGLRRPDDMPVSYACQDPNGPNLG